MVADKNITVNGEVKCSYCLRPRAKMCLKLSLLGDTLYCGLILLQAPSATDSSHHRIAPCTQLIPASASNYFTVAKYIEFSGLFQAPPLGQFSTSIIFFRSFSHLIPTIILEPGKIFVFQLNWIFIQYEYHTLTNDHESDRILIVNGSLAPPTSEAAQG